MKAIASFLLGTILFAACENLQDLSQVILEQPHAGNVTLTNEEVVAGLKEALNFGAEKAASVASMEDGFYKNPSLFIPFPEEAQQVKESALQYGFDAQVEQFERSLNRAAEEACKAAAPIFLQAIREMSVADGFSILNGGRDAATLYLKDKTTEKLRVQFRPKVDQAIETVHLTSYWEPIITKYNAVNILTGGEDIEPDLGHHVTDRAIEGLFILVAAEEARIRENPQARVTALLERVFSSVE